MRRARLLRALSNQAILTLLLASTPMAIAAPRSYVVDSEKCEVVIHLGKTGIASFAGHEHEVLATSVQGEVSADLDDLTRSSLDLALDAKSLRVSSKGEPPEDIPKILERMTGPEVLDAARFPTIRFHARRIEGKQLSPGVYDLRVTGELLLHGIAKALTIPVRVEVGPNILTSVGKFAIKQSDFGIEPTSAGGGLVKVEDEMAIRFRIVARAK